MKLTDLQYDVVFTLTSIGQSVIVVDDEFFACQSWQPEVDPFSKIVTGYTLIGKPLEKILLQAPALQSLHKLEDKRHMLIPKLDEIKSIHVKIYPDVKWKLYMSI